MSSLFKDPCFEFMDPISQMVEPFISPVLDIAPSINGHINVPMSELQNFLYKTLYNKSAPITNLTDSFRIAPIDVARLVVNVDDMLSSLDSAHRDYVESNLEVILPSNNISFSGPDDVSGFGAVKVQMTDESLKPELIKRYFLSKLSRRIDSSSDDRAQLSTIVDSLSLSKKIVSGRTSRAKLNLIDAITRAIEEDTWRVRSSVVIWEIATSIDRVLCSRRGWGEDLANLVHFKIMTHSNKPIYSFARIT